MFSGHDLLPDGYTAFNPQILNFEGQPHLAYTQFAGPRGGGESHELSSTKIFDTSYNQVREIRPSGNWRNLSLTQDLHEFNLADGGKTALITSYITFPQSVTYPHCDGNTTLFTKTGLFSEVTTDGINTEVFQWSASDYIDPTDTYVCPGEHLIGTGRTANDGFDFFHINSIDKDASGDYLVSGRHTSTVYKIAGKNSPSGKAPGEIIWRMGGKRNSFLTLDSEVPGTPYLNFSFQHHARWNSGIGGITLWDNGNNQIEAASANASSGISIRINSDESATLVGQYVSPGRQLDSSQGSHQVLPNGNHFLGMGSQPFMYESDANGTPVFYARFGVLPIQSYRAYKFEWTSNPPESEIGLFSFSKACYGDAVHYASFNGATELDSWEFYTGPSQDGPFVMAAQQPYNGTFETIVPTPFDLYAYAIAYDAAGYKLGQSKIIQTWTPDPEFGFTCSDVSCAAGTNYTTAPRFECQAPRQTPVSLETEAAPAPISGDMVDTPPNVDDESFYPIPRRRRRFIR